MNELQTRLQLALRLAADASDLILDYYQTDRLGLETKSDDSPVTKADRGAEELIRAGIQAAFADDGILGEEFPSIPGSSGYRWILDPIDGTKPFVHGVPLFGTLIGVESAGRMVAGVCRFPALREVVYAADSVGAWWQIADAAPRRARVTDCTQLDTARLMVTEPSSWRSCGRFEPMQRLMDATRLSRGWGDCYGHMMVATGRAELAVDPQMSAWDIAALIPILREAGGICMDWRGEENVDGGDGISVVPGLREAVLSVLQD